MNLKVRDHLPSVIPRVPDRGEGDRSVWAERWWCEEDTGALKGGRATASIYQKRQENEVSPRTSRKNTVLLDSSPVRLILDL